MSAIAKLSAWIFSPFIPPEQSARMMKWRGRREMPPPGMRESGASAVTGGLSIAVMLLLGRTGHRGMVGEPRARGMRPRWPPANTCGSSDLYPAVGRVGNGVASGVEVDCDGLPPDGPI